MKILIFNCLVYIVFVFSCTIAFSQSYGLSFYGHDVSKDLRTELNLSPEKEFTFKDEFELSFDLALHQPELFYYGYVFRIIFNGETNIDLIHGTRARGRDFTLIKGRNESLIAFNLDSPLEIDNWINIRIKFLLNEDKIILYENENVYVDSLIDLQTRSKVSISFGACSIEDFVSIDVPPIMIKDIKLFGNVGKALYHWPLDQYEGELAYDILDNRRARVENPDWLRRIHLNWTRIKEINLKGYAQPVNNQKEEKIYFLSEESLIVYDAKLNHFDTVFFKIKPGFLVSDGQAVYDHLSERILSYNVDKQQVFYLDPVSGDMSNNELEESGPKKDYLHHNKHLNETDSSIYIFNGYGHYLYKNRIFRCQIGSVSWEEIAATGDKPTPRYLAASGFLNDTLYFLGGYGSESGNQKLSPQHYYDLYAFSLKDLRYIKLDSFPDPPEDFCFANSMVIDPLTRHYYALSFPEIKYNSQLQLVRGSVNKGSLNRMGNLIPYQFNDINSFADLYYFPSTEKMYAVTTINDERFGTKIVLHSIGYPPIAKQPAPKQALELMKMNYFQIVLTGSLILLLLWLIIKLRSMRRKADVKSSKQITSPDLLNVRAASDRNNAIYFFGGFQVFDRTGTDITNKFTPLLKELFLIIILHSIKNEKGISSARIIEILWFDKSDRNARNNLSVNIAKLKHVLEELDGCEVTHKTGYWKIHQGKEMHNEYSTVDYIVNLKKNITPENISRLIEITNKGPFLVNLDFEWLDVFKGRISDRITDVLLSFAKTLNVSENTEQIIDLADCLFNFDVVNEEIMILKCRAQYVQGKHSLAKNTYTNFCSEYKILYGEDYLNSFNDIINLQT